MSTLTATTQLTRAQVKLEAREPLSLIFPFGMPILILVMNAMMEGNQEPSPEFGGMTPLDAYITPLTLLMVATILGVVYLPGNIAHYRDLGILRRISTTPANPGSVLFAQTVCNLLVSAIGVALAGAVGYFVFDISPPENVTGALASLALAVAAIYGIGLLLAALVPSYTAAAAVGMVAFFAMTALGGGFTSRENMPDWLATIGEYTPYGAGLQALSDSWVGASPEPLHLVTLGVTALAAGVAASTLFRWE